MNRTGTRCKSLEHRLFCTEDTDANCSPLCMQCGPMKQARSCERKEAYDHSGHRSWFASGGNWSAADRADWFLDGAGDLTRALGVSALVIGVLLAGLEPEEMLTAAIASAGGGPAIVEGALRLTQTIGISQGAVGVTPTTILWYSNYQALATRDIGVVPRHRSPRGGTYDRACDRSGSIPRAAPAHPGQPLRSLRSGEAHQEGVPRRLGHLRPGPHPARLRAHAHDARVHRGVSR